MDDLWLPGEIPGLLRRGSPEDTYVPRYIAERRARRPLGWEAE